MRVVLVVLFAAVALASGFIVVRAEDTRERIVRVEKRTVDACVDNTPRACRKLLNRLLHHATPRQKRRIRREAVETAQILSEPRVTRGEPESPRPQGARPKAEAPGSRKPKPPESQPQAEPPAEKPVTPSEKPVEPPPGPTPSPEPPKEPGPLKPLCDPLGITLPLC